MKIQNYLIVKSNGSVRVTKNKPALDFSEIAIHLNINVPDSLFKKPQLSATIDIQESQITPQVITAEIADNIRDLVQQNLGIELKIVQPED